MADGEPPFLVPSSSKAAKRIISATPRSSYADVVQNKSQNEYEKVSDSTHLVQIEDVSFKPVSQYQGKLAVIFPILEKSVLIEKLKYVLIGKFSHGRPPWSKIKDFFAALKLCGTVNISVFDQKHIYIECANQIDYNRIWLRLIWKVDGFSMRILKWAPHFTPRVESPVVPVWIRLEGIPLYLFEEMPLLQISNAIGRPIKIDARNLNRSMLNIARVCVELDISKPLLDSFWVCFEDKETGVVKEPIEVEVFYDSVPEYCPSCYHIGHKMEDCKRMNSTGKIEDASESKVDRNMGVKMKPSHLPKVTNTWKVVTSESRKLDKGKGIMQVEIEPSNEGGSLSTRRGDGQQVDMSKTADKEADKCELKGADLSQPQQSPLSQGQLSKSAICKAAEKFGTAVSNSFNLIANMEDIIEPILVEIESSDKKQELDNENEASSSQYLQLQSKIVALDGTNAAEVFAPGQILQTNNREGADNINIQDSIDVNAIVIWEGQAAEKKMLQPEVVHVPTTKNSATQAMALVEDTVLETRIEASNKQKEEAEEVTLDKTAALKISQNYKPEVEQQTQSNLKNKRLSWADECTTQAELDAAEVSTYSGSPTSKTQGSTLPLKYQASPYTPAVQNAHSGFVAAMTQESQQIGQKNNKATGVVTRSQMKATKSIWAEQVEEEQDQHTPIANKKKEEYQARQLNKTRRKEVTKLSNRINKIASRLQDKNLKDHTKRQLQADMEALKDAQSRLC